jgi:phage terminase large subunit
MKIDRYLLPKQKQLVLSQKRYICFSGSVACGKSQSLCNKLLIRALYPKAREILCRKTFASLKNSTLLTLLEGDGDMPPILPRGTYTHNKSDHVIRIKGGGEIIYFGLDDYRKIGSVNASGVAIDELTELEELDFSQLKSRIRSKHPLGNQIYGATNPSSPNHWAYKEWFDSPTEDHEVIMTRTEDNIFLSKEYIKSVSRLKGLARERLYLGKWVGAEGMVFSEYDPAFNDTQFAEEFKYYAAGVDDGFSDPFAIVIVGVTSNNRYTVVDEFYKTEMTTTAKVDVLKKFQDKYNLNKIVVDYSATDLIDGLIDHGLYVDKCEKGADSIFNGIMQLQDLFSREIEGKRILTINYSCTNLKNELLSYEWAKDKSGLSKDKPIDKNNHAIDALRYIIKDLDNKGNSPFYIHEYR